MKDSALDARIGFRRFLSFVLLARLMEALLIVIVSVLSSTVEATLASSGVVVGSSIAGAAFYGAMIVVWYYFGFQYLLCSVVGMSLVWRVWSRSAFRLTVTGCAIFLAHSMIINFWVLPGAWTARLIFVWVSMLGFNLFGAYALYKAMVQAAGPGSQARAVK